MPTLRSLAIPLLFLVALPACRRPAPMATAAPLPAPTAAAPEPEAENERAEPTPPPPPPEPTTPSSPPPTGEVGFTFGLSRRDSMNLCSTKATWRREGTNYACTAALENPGFEGTPVLSYCDDRLCAIGIAVVPPTPDYTSWDQTFTKIKEALVARHGSPTTATETLPEACKSDTFQECLSSGQAERELTWRWPNHLVSLRMSKKKSGDGAPAIRFVSRPSQ